MSCVSRPCAATGTVGWPTIFGLRGRGYTVGMQFRHLRYFVSVVEAGSFSRAAVAIHVAQPALSQQIAELEERLGQTLLKRSSRGVRPTPAGDALYRKASAILRQLERLPELVTGGTHAIRGGQTLTRQ